VEAFLVVRTTAGIPVTVLMLVFSYRFPRWYWERKMRGQKLKRLMQHCTPFVQAISPNRYGHPGR
jgi:hypothetical protein